MHMMIWILVFAMDKEQALNAASRVASEKLGLDCKGRTFDYDVVFSRDGLGVTGDNRLGPLPPAVLQVGTARFPTDDERGLEFVNLAMENNRLRFKESMAVIRHLIAKYTDDQLFDEVEGDEEIQIEGKTRRFSPDRLRACCEGVCGYAPGSHVHLYDFCGRTVSRPEILQRILEDSDSNPWFVDLSEGQDPCWGPHIWNQPLWAVPLDVHY